MSGRMILETPFIAIFLIIGFKDCLLMNIFRQIDVRCFELLGIVQADALGGCLLIEIT